MHHIYEITYTDSKVVVHETIIAESVPAAIEKFNIMITGDYIDIVGVVEEDLPLLLRKQGL